MSSGVEVAPGVVAAAVVVPTAVVAVGAMAALAGTGWIAWQGGKLLVDLNNLSNQKIADVKLKKEQEEISRINATIKLSTTAKDLMKILFFRLPRANGTNFCG